MDVGVWAHRIMRVLVFIPCVVLGPAWAAWADWEAMVLGDGTFTVSYHHAPIVRCQYLFFGPAWKWAAPELKLRPRSDGGWVLSGTVKDLGLELLGLARSEPGAIVFDYRINAERDWSGINGGALEFEIDYKSPALKGAAEPALLPDRRGWRWDSGVGVVQVGFDKPLADARFEQGNKGRIRLFFIGERIRRGTQSLTVRVSLPEGTRLAPSPDQRYGEPFVQGWRRSVLAEDESPVDLRYLNERDRPAGRRGFVRAEGGGLVFGDGSPARFWGTNVSAYALFDDKRTIQAHARRLASLGFNLVRLHHHDSAWVKPNVLSGGGGTGRGGPGLLNADALDSLDWWVKCLRDEGVYTWIDLHVGRGFTPDEVPEGYAEFARRPNHGQGYAYFNDAMRRRMREFNEAYLSHVNVHTGTAYKDDPAIIGLLITNENDLTFHFGNPMADRKANPFHGARMAQAIDEFCRATGLPEKQVWRTWEPGAGKVFLSHREHVFNADMLAPLRGMGITIPIATTNYWSGCSGFSLPSLAEGDIIDVHSYGQGEALSVNPRYSAHYLATIAGAQLADHPLSISEWNVFYPAPDRFTAPMFMAAISALQGWDAPMLFVYANTPLSKPWTMQRGVVYADPAMTATLPAAALTYRRGDIHAAKNHYCLKLTPEQLFGRRLDAGSAAAIRTLCEQSRISLALPDTPELDWDRATSIPADAKVITDPDRDFLPAEADFVESDTGEVVRNWVDGLQSINTEKTAAVSGWMEGREWSAGPLGVKLENPKATVVLTSLDDLPLVRSRRILLTAIARAVLAEDKTSFVSEPIVGAITIRSELPDLAISAINRRGQELDPLPVPREGGAYKVRLPVSHGTHWFVLTSKTR